MKMILYYSFCTVKNQIRKLFKTWVAVLLAVCFAFGLLFGLGASFLEDTFLSEEEPMGGADVIEGELPDDALDEEEPLTDAELSEVYGIIELVAGGIVLLVLVFSVFGADKSGNAIFLPADVPILFSSPQKPQSVLLFRLVMQMGSFLCIGIYMLFQLPSMLSSGVPPWAFFGILGAFILLLILSKLIQVLLYTYASTHRRVKSLLRPVTLSLLVLLAGAAALYASASPEDPLRALTRFFNAPVTRFIPVWGWLKGLCMYMIEENWLGAALCLLGNVAVGVVLCIVIPRLHADFYEDAMAKSEETAAILDAAQNASSGVTVIRQNKKDRSEKLKRDGLCRGQGASVYFFKAMYNRFRFATLGIFTKTSITYLAVAIGVSLLCKLAFDSSDLLPVCLVLSAFVFYRSLGNPLSQDMGCDSFVLVPENAWKKTFYSLMGGSLNCLLDLLPAYLAAILILGANPLYALLWILFALTLDFYSTNAGVFIDLSIPTVTGKNIKAVIQICFIYFGLLPDAVILLIAGLISPALLPVAAILASLVNLALGAVFFAFSPMFIEYGRK